MRIHTILTVGLVAALFLVWASDVLAYGTATFVQEHYRWRNDDGSETAATWKAAANTAITGAVRSQNIRLRFCVANTSTSYSGSINARLEFATSTSGPWTAVSTETNKLTAFEMMPTSGYADGAAATALLTGTGTFVPGKCVEHPSNAGASVTMNTNQYSNFEYCFRATAKARGSTTYYFRVTNSGTALTTYSKYAALTMASGEANEPPKIVSALTAQASTQATFSYAIQASGSEPITYGASGLPAGLTFGQTNKITGQATDPGTYPVGLSATSAWGTDAPTLMLTVMANVPPVASNQTASVVEGGEVQIILIWTDVDNPLLTNHTFEVISPPSHGVLETYAERYPPNISYPSYYYYRAFPGYQGTDMFIWKCRDLENDSNLATCTVTVRANTAPRANNQSVTVPSAGTVSINLSKTDPDAGQIFTYERLSGPDHGTLACPEATQPWTYCPEKNYTGTDTFTWRCNDGVTDSNIGTVTVTVPATAPAPQDQTAAIKKGVVTDIPALYTGGGGYTLTFVKKSSPSTLAGTLTVVGDQFHFVPKTNYTGTTSFSWCITYSNASTPATNTAAVRCTIVVNEDDGSSDWPMWRKDEQRTGLTTQSLPEDLHLQWRWDLPAVAYGYTYQNIRFEYCNEPVVLGKTMIVALSRNNMLLAVDTETGAEQWRYYAEGAIRTAPAACRLGSGAGRVYAASDDGYLHCVDAATGSLVWKKRGGPSSRKMLGFDRLMSTWPCMTSPIVRDGIVHFTAGMFTIEGVFVYALNAETGDVAWFNDSSLGHAYGKILPNTDEVVPLGTGGRTDGIALSPTPMGYPVIPEGGTLFQVPNGTESPASYYLDTGAIRNFSGGEGAKSAFNMWFSPTGASLDARPVSITAGARMYTATAAAQLGVAGTVYTLLAADNKLFVVTASSLYCFAGTQTADPPTRSLSTTALPTINDTWTSAAATMRSQVGSGGGVCLVWGIGSGRLAVELVKQSGLIVNAFDASSSKCVSLRDTLDGAGLYGAGGKSGIFVGSPMEHIDTPTIARLVAVEDLSASGFSAGVVFAKKMCRALRPNGGQGWLPTTSAQHNDFASWVNQAGLQEVTVTRNGNWTVMKRTGLPGGLAGYVRPPFGVLWFMNSGYVQNNYSGGSQKCITLPVVGAKDNDGTAPAGADPGTTMVNPLTGLSESRSILKEYGCAGWRDHGNLWVARSSCFGVYDKWRDSGTIHLVNARPTCSGTMWQYDDGTAVLYGPGCPCNYAHRLGISFVPMTDEDILEQWAEWYGDGRWNAERIEDVPIRRLGVNFGAMGCRRDGDETLWVAYPKWHDCAPKIPVEFSPPNPDRYYHHASRITGGDGPGWVSASGVKGINTITIGLTRTAVAKQISGAPVTDGVLSDACWDGASPIYLSHDEAYGLHESATAYIRYDSSKLYIGLKKEGNYAGSAETFDVYLSGRNRVNSNGIADRYLRYSLSATGARKDAVACMDLSYTPPVEDHAWNGAWLGSVSTNGGFFTGEMAIPWSEIDAQGIVRDRLLVNIWGPGLTRMDALSVNGSIYESIRPSADRGCERFTPLYLDIARGPIAVARPHKVRLHFAEIFDVAVGARVFDVKLQGQTVLSNFDIRAAAGGRRRSVVREFNVNITDNLNISFVPKAGKPLICGVEIVNETEDGVNLAPAAVVNAYPATSAAPLRVALTAEDSYDKDSAQLTYEWDLGGGNVASGRDVVHTYEKAGVYTATVTVTDDEGALDTAQVVINANGTGKVPEITSALSAAGSTNTPFSYTLTASGTAPIVFLVGKLPAGLSFDYVNKISGTPEANGTFKIAVVAVNGLGQDCETLDLRIADTPTPQYTVTTTTVGTGSGMVTLDPSGGLYFSGAYVYLQAYPNAGSVFAGWSGDLTSTVNPVRITVNSNKNVIATFNTTTNTPPTISNIGARTIEENSSTGPIAFTIGDTQTPATSLSLTKASTSSNTKLIPTGNIVFGGGGASRTVTATPVTNQTGTATITVTVSDGSLTASDSFLLTVVPGNDAPTCAITSPSDGASFAPPATVTINAIASDADGVISRVEFYQGAVKLGEDATSPYCCTWTGVAAGTYSLTAKARDDKGIATSSSAISITVNGGSIDTDGDGLPDATDPDDDNDGMPDVDEAVAGTDPLDAGNRFQVSGFRFQGGDIGLWFDSVSGRVYGVYCRDDLLAGQWVPLQTNLAGTGNPIQFTDSASGQRRFYRLRVKLP